MSLLTLHNYMTSGKVLVHEVGAKHDLTSQRVKIRGASFVAALAPQKGDAVTLCHRPQSHEAG